MDRCERRDEDAFDSDDEDDDHVPSVHYSERFIQQMKDIEAVSMKKIERTPLTEGERKYFLAHAGQQVDVLNDTFPDMTELMQARDQVEDAFQLADARTLNKNDNTMDKTEREQSLANFWKIRKDMTARTAQYPSWEEACELLGIPQDEALGGIDAINWNFPPCQKPFRPVVVQVIAVAWMRKMEASPIRGGILALDAGLGKTLTAIYLMFKDYEDGKKAYEKNKASEHPVKMVFKPNLVACPAVVIQVWVTEILMRFPTLRIRTLYSSENESGASESQKYRSLKPDIVEARHELETTYPSDDPETLNVVVITSFETFAKRACKEVKRNVNLVHLRNEGLQSDRKSPSPTSWGRQGAVPRTAVPPPTQKRAFWLPPPVFTTPHAT